jgi:DNA-binding protein WhiA
VLMTAALTDELSRLPLTTPCCRRAETITLLRFAGAVRQEPGRCSIEVDLATPLVARRLGMAIRVLYGYPTQLQVLPTSGYPAATHHRLQVTSPADAAALARRTGLADPRGRLVRGLPAPIVAAGVCDAAAIWRGAFLVAGSLTEPHRFPALDITCPSLEAAMALVGAARRLGITARTKHIRDVDRVTVRDPDAITALLTQIGAPDTAATWARHRTHHREHTPGTRLPGFDDANHTRATLAAADAAARVQRALVILGDQVPDNLTAAAALRITHREVSLEALGQMMNPPMTKDAVAGRIRRLLALADATAQRTGIPDTTTALTPNMLDQP